MLECKTCWGGILLNQEQGILTSVGDWGLRFAGAVKRGLTFIGSVFAGAWRGVLRGSCPDAGMGAADAEVIHTITEHYMAGWKRQNRTGRRPAGGEEGEAALIRASWSYRIGRFITFIPRKLRGAIRCYQEHGRGYTWQRVLVHLGLKEDPFR